VAENYSFAAASFTSRDDMAKRLVDRALNLLPRRESLRMLDLGCGSGAVAIEAARRQRDWCVVALDIGAPNIAATRQRAEAEGLGSRVEAVCADYLSWRAGPFDLIVSDSVLYVIPGADEALAACLAADLAPGGILVITTPIESIANRARIALRHAWRALPPAADKLPYLIARRLYPDFPPRAVAERVGYLRVIPTRLYGRSFSETLRRAGIEQIVDEPWESSSVAKLAHRLVALRRVAKTAVR